MTTIRGATEISISGQQTAGSGSGNNFAVSAEGSPLPPQFMGRITPNARSVENERRYGASEWNSDIALTLNNPRLEGVVRVFGAGFTEEFPSLVVINTRPLDE